MSIYGNGIWNTGTWSGTGVPYISGTNTPTVRPISQLVFSPLDLGPVNWWDGSDSANILTSIGPNVPATVGQTVRRWVDKVGGANLDQATSNARWTLSSGNILTPPQSNTAGLDSSIPINYQSYSIVFVYGPRTFYNQQPAALWLQPSNVTGAIMSRLGGTIYGPTTTGAIGAYDANGSLLAFCSGTGGVTNYNSYKSVSLAVRNSGSTTITRLFDYSVGGNPAKLPVKHVLVFNRQLSSTEIESLRVWAAMPQREGVLSTFGDSIIAGAIANTQAQSFANQLAQTKGWTLANGAISGTQLSFLIGQDSEINASYTSGKANWLLLNVGSNDLAANVSGATYLASLATFYTARKTFAADWDVAVCTIPPRNDGFSNGQNSAGYDAQRAIVNAALQAADPGTYFDRLVNFATDPDIGPDAAANDTVWFNADKIHPNQNGHNRMAVITGNAYP